MSLRAKPLFVRVNPLDSGLIEADLDAIVKWHVDGIVLPKAEGGASVDALADMLAARRNATARILPIATETPAAIFALGSYGGAKRLAGLTWGAEDLPAAVGAATSREEDGRYTAPYELARSLCLFGAAAAGVPAIETVYPAFRDLDGLAAYAARARRDGFGNDGDPPGPAGGDQRRVHAERGRDRACRGGGRRVRGQSRGGRAGARRPDDRSAAPRPGTAHPGHAVIVIKL